VTEENVPGTFALRFRHRFSLRDPQRAFCPYHAVPVKNLTINERDKARMHELAVRNQDDALTPAEKEELFGFAKATSLLSILKSKARRTLGIKLKRRTVS
jgi:hypothetical protein